MKYKLLLIGLIAIVLLISGCCCCSSGYNAGAPAATIMPAADTAVTNQSTGMADEPGTSLPTLQIF